MKHELYSNKELSDLRDRLNKEISRRGTFTWWDPLVQPTVGTDRESRKILPDVDPSANTLTNRHGDVDKESKVVTDNTYLINNPSDGALEETRNSLESHHGDNPGGQNTDPSGNDFTVNHGNPQTSATRFDQDEMRNYLIGLSKMHDINLYYGRDERMGSSFRNLDDIRSKVSIAESDILHAPVDNTEEFKNGKVVRVDPNNGGTRNRNPLYDAAQTNMEIPRENINSVQTYAFPSGQRDGEEIQPGHDGPDETNFYDDHGANISSVSSSQLIGDGGTTKAGENTTNVLLVTDAEQKADINPSDTRKTNYPNSDVTPNPPTSNNVTLGVKTGTVDGKTFKQSTNGGADRMISTGSKYGGITNHPDSKSDYKKYHLSNVNGSMVTDGKKIVMIGENETIPPLTNPNGDWRDNSSLAYHPQNPYVSPKVTSVEYEQNNQREITTINIQEGNKSSVRFGLNPRNPQLGDEYTKESYRPVFSGKVGICRVACTGMCYRSCDSECSESCQTTCWNRCGDACVSACSNVCTGCNSLCYSTCKTKCQNNTGYSCLNAGAETVTHVSEGTEGETNIGAKNDWPANKISGAIHRCDGCSYTCQFYPNYKTTCWDALCQNMCFYSCYTYCSNGCYGGCIDNINQHTVSYPTLSRNKKNAPSGTELTEISIAGGSNNADYPITMGKDKNDPLPAVDANAIRQYNINPEPVSANNFDGNRGNNLALFVTGRGQACREGCSVECVGSCFTICIGDCKTACFANCTSDCYDSCNNTCDTRCGDGCGYNCKESCKDTCGSNCSGDCMSTCQSSAQPPPPEE